MSLETVFVDKDDAGSRLDVFLSAAYSELSRSYIQKIIKDGGVFKSGVTLKPSYKVASGDEISFDIPEPVSLKVEAEDIPLDILYEDEDLLFINKPKGMVVHPGAGHMTGTVVNALLYHCGDSLSGINGVLRPGIVHRIDKDTSGVIVVCKNDLAHRGVALQLAEHSVNRRYYAIANGRITEDGTVDANIGRSQTNRLKMSVMRDGGKRAVTHYHVIDSFDKYSYIECKLETGRTHQIRVHMDYIHHPLMGDQVYGNIPCPFKTEGQVLHAGVLGLIHPRTGEYIEFKAPLPDYFEAILGRL